MKCDSHCVPISGMCPVSPAPVVRSLPSAENPLLLNFRANPQLHTLKWRDGPQLLSYEGAHSLRYLEVAGFSCIPELEDDRFSSTLAVFCPPEIASGLLSLTCAFLVCGMRLMWSSESLLLA